MAAIGHFHDAAGGASEFRVFAPGKREVLVALADGGAVALSADPFGWWSGRTARLPHGTLYWIEVDGRRLPDPASRCQPQGVHGPSMVVEVEPAASPLWHGVRIEDAVIYELHVGTFTAAGTLAAAQERLVHLFELGINVIELMPIAAFPGERNWGYDGTFLFALHTAYGDYRDLKAFIEAAHALGIAVILDVVYNHFGPEGHYGGAFAPYSKAAATPWGAAVNFDGAWNHGVRAFYLDNVVWWLEEVGFDGLRMDAVSLIFDNMPVHILREITDLARAIGTAQQREVLMIAEHLRNDRFVTHERGFAFHAQWNDDLNHALFAKLTGETGRHHANFGSFGDVVKALQSGFVLDGTRLDRVYHWPLGTDGRLTRPAEHVVHIQDHDQVGNRLLGDRMVATYGRARALLAVTAVFASPFVPMLFMGEEYGETAPFLFFEDFSDPAIIDGARKGRKADFGFGGIEPPDPHARATFEASKLQWPRCESEAGGAVLAYYRALIALKRSGELGPRHFADVRVDADAAAETIVLAAPRTLTVLNFADAARPFAPPPGWALHLSSMDTPRAGELQPFEARILKRSVA